MPNVPADASSNTCSNVNGLANGNTPANADEEDANAARNPPAAVVMGMSAPTGTDVSLATPPAITASPRTLVIIEGGCPGIFGGSHWMIPHETRIEAAFTAGHPLLSTLSPLL
jgi:hypothetical protein